MTKSFFLATALLFGSVLLTACGGGGGDAATSPTYASPALGLGDSLTYAKTETTGGMPSDSQVTYVVTERTPTAVSLTDGTTTRRFSAGGGRYVPEFEQGVSGYPDNYTSTTTYDPPPAAGESYVYTTFVPGPWAGTGENVTTTVPVTAVGAEQVTVPAGSYSARKVVLEKPDNGTTAIITRYYVSGIGVVEELTGYDFYGVALGSESRPLTAAAPVNYRGRIGTGKLYFRISGLPANGTENIYLTALTDNADLEVYSDAFVTISCKSANTGSTNETCNVTTSAAGELYIIVDGSATADGTYFVLSAGN